MTDRHLAHGDEIAGLDPFVLVRGQGSTVWDAAGRPYLDAHAGAWSCQIGHGRPEMAAVAARQLAQLEHFTTRREFATPPAQDLAARLVEVAGWADGAVRYACSGSEADDDALQVVWEYHRRRGQPARRTILVLDRAYHGHTLAGRRLAGAVADPEIVHLTMPDRYLFAGSDAELTGFFLAEL